MLIYYRVLHKIQTYLNCNPPVSSIHGILQARILEWVAIPFSERSSPPRDQTRDFTLPLPPSNSSSIQISQEKSPALGSMALSPNLTVVRCA